MGKLVYLMNLSLDGFVETPDRSLDWTNPDDEVFAWFTERQGEAEVSIYGRRLWEGMAAAWPNRAADPDATDLVRAYARAWNATLKVVFSHELESVEHGARL